MVRRLLSVLGTFPCIVLVEILLDAPSELLGSLESLGRAGDSCQVLDTIHCTRPCTAEISIEELRQCLSHLADSTEERLEAVYKVIFDDSTKSLDDRPHGKEKSTKTSELIPTIYDTSNEGCDGSDDKADWVGVHGYVQKPLYTLPNLGDGCHNFHHAHKPP